jgi:5'-nucleotidase
MRILLTNDDGITSRGLFAAKQALDEVGEVSVIAPDSNRSAVGRGITIDRSLTVTEVELRDGSRGYATDGTPVDCVRFAELGLLGERPDLIVAGINYGVNLGDDVTYSGTVAAAFEGIVLGIPAIAVSQQSKEAGLHFRQQRDYDFSPAAGILTVLARHVAERGLPPGTILNVNAPPPPVKGVQVARLGRRIYRDQLELESDDAGRRRYRIYGDDPSYHDEPDTDFRAIAEGKIAVTPVHLDLTSAGALEEIARWPLG